jgi:hypothetical protein
MTQTRSAPALTALLLCAACGSYEDPALDGVNQPLLGFKYKNSSGAEEQNIMLRSHRDLAAELVATIRPSDNIYATKPNYIRFAGVDGATKTEARNMCSTFVTNILKHSYKWSNRYFKNWLQSTSPYAETYHEAIMSENRFSNITNIDQVDAGDLMSIKYPDKKSDQKSRYTGHMAIIAEKPTPRESTRPILRDTRQYRVPVYDTSGGGHGYEDTRYTGGLGWRSGVGYGYMRLYTNLSGEIVGYTWSERGGPFYSMRSNPVVVGRLTNITTDR